MTAAAGRHPTDEERERAARPALEALLAALRAGDEEALAVRYADDAAWLGEDGTRRGARAAAAAHLRAAGRGATWEPPQQHGAKAVLRWRRPDGARGAVVVEVRRDRVVFAAG